MIKKPGKKTNKTKRFVPSIFVVYKNAWLDVSSFWKTLLAVLAVYGVLNFIFVAGFSLLPSSETIQADITAVLGESAGRAIDSFTLVGISLLDISSPSNTALQMILVAIASMAFIWTIRKLRGLQKITIRQAYYEGPSNSIPFILVISMLLLTLIPLSIASTVVTYAMPIVSSVLERVIVIAVSLALAYLTFYWLSVWWPSVYISMLPGTKPIAAMRAAAQLTKRRRFRISLVSFGVIVTLLSLFIFVTLPLSLIWQRAVPLIVYTSLVLLFGIGHLMFFNLYRSLVDESEPTKKSKKS